MTIKRNGIEYVLTADELLAAYHEQVQLFAEMYNRNCFCGEDEDLFSDHIGLMDDIVLYADDYDFFDCEEDNEHTENNGCKEPDLVEDEYCGDGFDKKAYDELISEIDSGIFGYEEGD